ncbi:MAG: peptidylprolyl isomerase [Zavarzinella sp.]
MWARWTRFALLPIFTGFFLLPMAQADEVVARVNGEPITSKQLETAVQLAGPTKNLSPVEKQALRNDVLGLLIDDQVVRQFLDKYGVKVPETEIEKQINALQAILKEQGQTQTQFLKETMQTEEQLRNNYRYMVQLAKYLDSLITEEKLQHYFQQHQDFFRGTTVRLSHIVVRLDHSASTADHQEIQARLLGMREKIAAGNIVFADAARRFSHCPTASSGGDLGWIVRKWQIDEALAATAFQMKVGQISGVVTTEAGYHLVYVTDRKEGAEKKYDEVKRDVRRCYETELRQALLRKLRAEAKVEITR